MIFNAKNRKLINRIWAGISILAILGMVGFSLVALIQ
jgi:ABC-type nitrate/sulfonate/bicarbonate transport system permease component